MRRASRPRPLCAHSTRTGACCGYCARDGGNPPRLRRDPDFLQPLLQPLFTAPFTAPFYSPVVQPLFTAPVYRPCLQSLLQPLFTGGRRRLRCFIAPFYSPFLQLVNWSTGPRRRTAPPALFGRGAVRAAGDGYIARRHTHTRTHAHTHARTHTHTRTHAHAHAHARTRTQHTQHTHRKRGRACSPSALAPPRVRQSGLVRE